MHQPPVPNDAARLVALSQYQILDTPPDAAFDDLARAERSEKSVYCSCAQHRLGAVGQIVLPQRPGKIVQ